MTNVSVDVVTTLVKQYITNIPTHMMQQVDGLLLSKLSSSGIHSLFLQQSDYANNMMTIGVSGKIDKNNTSIFTNLLNDAIDLSTMKIEELVILIGSNTTIDFRFYKALTDTLVAKGIQAVYLVTELSDTYIDRGVDFIHKFTGDIDVHRLVDKTIPIDSVLDNFPTQTSTTV